MVVHQHILTGERTGLRRLPLGAFGALADLVGLGLTALLIYRTYSFGSGLSTDFFYLLIGLSIASWMVIGQVKLGFRSFSYHAYRFAAVPSIAGIMALAIAAALGRASPAWAVLTFVATWTLWIVVVRYALRRQAPPLRALCIGSGRFCSQLGDHSRFELQQASAITSDLTGWDLVVVEDSALADPEWQRWLVHADLAGLKIVTEPAARETLTGQVPLESLDADLALGLFKRDRSYLFWKRLMDLSIVAVTAPLIVLTCLLVAVILLLDSGTPVLFSQWRVGKDGKKFRIYKFRTMRRDAESNGAVFASQGDPRVTRIGAFLRKFRLDELPQFWNVVRGDMSIIGPRPEQVDFVDEFCRSIPLYELRHWVPPGITGWAQVTQGYAAGCEETRVKLSYDLFYVKHCSLILDLMIVLKTCRTILTGFGSR